MTTATAEKSTCKYIETDEWEIATECMKRMWIDVTENYTYCPNCGRKIERVEENNS